MKIVEYFSVNSDCYKNNVNKVDSRYITFQNKGARGIMLHSVSCAQPSALVFAKKWNKSGGSVAVHAVLQADGTVYHCLPWNFRGCHAGGSANNTHIGVEMTEPDCIKYTGGATFTCSDINKAKAQVEGTYKTAVELFAYLCKKYGLDPMTDIISHKEGNKKGVASGHVDPEHLWDQLKTGYTMDTFREAVKEAMGGVSTAKPETPKVETTAEMYRVRKSWDDSKSQIGAYATLKWAKLSADKHPDYKVFNSSGDCVYPVPEEKVEEETKVDTPFKVKVSIKDLNIRKGPGYKTYESVGICPVGIYTIIETKVAEGYTWGLLKSKVGWIALEHTKRL